MTPDAPIVEARIRRASLLICAGLLLQLLSLVWSHPLAFVFFLAVGCPLVAAGTVMYLLALVRPR